jgi:tetratricopeptide (TPR) repeat protein
MTDKAQDRDFEKALSQAKADPASDAHWDALEALGSGMQKQDEVAATYREVLRSERDPALAASIGQRAAQWHEEWLADDPAALPELLSLVLEIDPEQSWAFQRLTVLHTSTGRWEELLTVYDNAIVHAHSADEKKALLDEARNIAKDVGDGSATLRYMRELVRLSPSDKQLADSLEKQLEKLERHQDLVELWRERAQTLSGAARADVELRIAGLLAGKLNQADAALRSLKALLSAGERPAEVLALLEQIAGDSSVPAALRREVLETLTTRYRALGRDADVVRTLEAALALSEGGDSTALHRETARRLGQKGDDAGAFKHWVSVLDLEPLAVDALDAARALGAKLGDTATLVLVLDAAAAASSGEAEAQALEMEAAELVRAKLGDAAGALARVQRAATRKHGDRRARLAVFRRLVALLEEAGDSDGQLLALVEVVGLEDDPAERRMVSGNAARLAERIGAAERALEIWDARIAADPKDSEALDARIDLLARMGKADELARALTERATALGSSSRARTDWVRAARVLADDVGDVARAIGVWKFIGETFGEDTEVVDALGDLFRRAGNHEELAEILVRTAEREAEHIARILGEAAVVQQGELGRTADAIESYAKALTFFPEHAGARAALVALLREPKHRRAALELLTDAYRRTGDWQAALGLVDARVESASAGADRAEVLRQAAEVVETRGNDKAQAFAFLARALPEKPGDVALEQGLLRLAAATKNYAGAVAPLELASEAAASQAAAGGAAPDAARAAHLRLTAAELRAEHLGEAAEANAVFMEALRAAPDRADLVGRAMKTAMDAGSVGTAVEAALLHARARGFFDPAGLGALRDAPSASAGREVVRALLRSVESLGLRGRLAHDVAMEAAALSERTGADASLTREALSVALTHDPLSRTALLESARVGKGAPDEAVFEILERVATLDESNLDALVDALDVAERAGVAREARERVLSRLHHRASTMLRGGVQAAGTHGADETVRRTLADLSELASARGDSAELARLALDVSSLPFALDEQIRWLEVAGRSNLAAGDRDRAAAAFRSVLERVPGHRGALDALAKLAEEDGRLTEMLVLRRTELGLAESVDRRLGLRLEIVRLVGEIERREGRVEALLKNLEERPGHMPSIEALMQILETSGRHEELVTMLEREARNLEAGGDSHGSARLWQRAATIAETRLADADRAVLAYRRVVELHATPQALDALAKLRADRGDHASAAQWLERRLLVADATERTHIALRLARAHLAAGHRDKALGGLEAAFRENPASVEIRDTLKDAYRSDGRTESLAWLLAEAAPHVSEPSQLVEYARESAILYRGLGKVERAVAALRLAVDTAPEDRELRIMLADALRAQKSFGEAREVLRKVIEEFGRRRNAERAQVHFLLAQVEEAAGDHAAALEQLDLASSMDAANPLIARMLGDVAFDAEDYARAERAYRALLLVVRRQPPGDDPKAVGLAEVHYGLSRVAEARGDAAQAAEQRTAALEAAEASDAESERMVRALQKSGDSVTALEVLERRLPRTEARAKVLSALGRILGADLNRGEEGLARLLEAIDVDASDDGVHRQARLLAVETDGSARYADALRRAASRLKPTDARQASDLLLRLVRVLEEDLQDYAAAIAVSREVEALGQHRPEAWVALARLAKAGGDSRTEVEALERIVTMNEPSIIPEVRTDAMFGLAAIQLGDSARQEEGIALLSRALDLEPRYTQAGGLLRGIKAEPSPTLMSLYGRVARSSTDASILLDFLERRAHRVDATLEEVREAIELARGQLAGVSQGDRSRVRALLERALEVASATHGGLAAHLWVPRELAQESLVAGDVAGAMRWMGEAAASATGDEALELWTEAARLALEAGATEEARAIYERLFTETPTDRRVWEPYLTLLREAGDEARFNDVIGEVVGSLDDASARNAVRIERARYLLTMEGREPDAAEVLREALRDEPSNTEAAKLLADLFERTGYSEELEGLLGEQLGRAREERDLARIKELSLRLGSVLARVRREDAMEVYRHGLTWTPDDADLAGALLALFAADHDPREWAQTLERLLRTAEGDEAARLSLEVAERWSALGDDEAVARVLELGYGAAADSAEVRGRLEQFYQGHEDWAALASYMVREARRVTDAATGVALFRNAAALYLDQLEDAKTAASALAEALELAPGDADLLAELVSARVSEGALEEADAEVSRALEQPHVGDAMRAPLLRARGGVRLAMGRDVDAVSDLEQAYVLGGAPMGAELADALRVAAERAAERGDGDSHRNFLLRLVQVLSEIGRGAEARVFLGEWTHSNPGDIEALALLCDIDEAGERWDALIEGTRRLSEITSGDERAQAVLRHADACARAGRPDEARSVIERMVREEPGRPEFRQGLMKLYADSGAHAELAVLLMEDAQAEPKEDLRHALLRRAGFLFIQGGNPDAALAPLEEAVRMKPSDHESVLLLVDGLIAAERYADAGGILEKAIEAHPKRRSPELAELQSRMATLAQKAGDANLEMQWLNAAMESDKGNGEIVARLANLAMDLKEYDVAENALRVVTLSKTEGPMSRAMAFLLQGRIAHQKGEQRRAILWARKAKSEDPSLREADEFLAELGA